MALVPVDGAVVNQQRVAPRAEEAEVISKFSLSSGDVVAELLVNVVVSTSPCSTGMDMDVAAETVTARRRVRRKAWSRSVEAVGRDMPGRAEDG